jgi:hypothetical protein
MKGLVPSLHPPCPGYLHGPMCVLPFGIRVCNQLRLSHSPLR